MIIVSKILFFSLVSDNKILKYRIKIYWHFNFIIFEASFWSYVYLGMMTQKIESERLGQTFMDLS